MPTYRSKIDAWLGGLLLAAASISVYASASLLLSSAPGAWPLAIISVSLGAGLPLWLLFGTDYRIESGQLLVRSGPFKWRIEIASIRQITHTRNPISSPALSLDRLQIDYGHGQTLLISPRFQEQFLTEIRAGRSSGNTQPGTPTT